MRLEAPSSWADEAWMQYPIVGGFYQMRKPGAEHWTKRPYLPVKIVWVDIPDEDDPTFCTWDWQALLNGEPVSIGTVWPWCKPHPITEDQYREMLP